MTILPLQDDDLRRIEEALGQQQRAGDSLRASLTDIATRAAQASVQAAERSLAARLTEEHDARQCDIAKIEQRLAITEVFGSRIDAVTTLSETLRTRLSAVERLQMTLSGRCDVLNKAIEHESVSRKAQLDAHWDQADKTIQASLMVEQSKREAFEGSERQARTAIEFRLDEAVGGMRTDVEQLATEVNGLLSDLSNLRRDEVAHVKALSARLDRVVRLSVMSAAFTAAVLLCATWLQS